MSRLDAGFAVLTRAVRDLVAHVFGQRKVVKSRQLSADETAAFRVEMAEHGVDDESRDEVPPTIDRKV